MLHISDISQKRKLYTNTVTFKATTNMVEKMNEYCKVNKLKKSDLIRFSVFSFMESEEGKLKKIQSSIMPV